MVPPRPAPAAAFPPSGGVEILFKSLIERWARESGAGGRLACDRKIVLNMAVPSGSSGREASLVAQVVEVEENDTQAMQTDVAYKPEEHFVKTHKCEPEAGGEVVKSCERLRDQNGHIIEHTEPVCCPCGPQHRVPSSCGTFFDRMVKGKVNTAHCLRFQGSMFLELGQGLLDSASEYK